MVLVALGGEPSAKESCELAPGRFVRLRQQVVPAHVGSRFSLEVDGTVEPAVLSLRGVPEAAVEGEVAFSFCRGGVFLVVFDTGSVNQPGFAVRINPKSKKHQTLYFAQKGRPRFLQNTALEFSVTFDTDGLDPDAAPFIRVSAGSIRAERLQQAPDAGVVVPPTP